MNKRNKLQIFVLLVLVLSTVLTGCSVDNANTVLENKAFVNLNNGSEMQKLAAENMMKTIDILSKTDGARVAGFDEEKAGADFIASAFKESGLTVEMQKFPMIASSAKKIEVKMETPTQKSFDAQYWFFGIKTPPDGIRAEVVAAGTGTGTDLANFKGKIVLVKRGGEPVYEKVKRAANAGAVAVLFYQEGSDTLITGTLVEKNPIPAVMIKDEAAKIIGFELSEGKKVEIYLNVDSEIKYSSSNNIIAEIDVTKKYPDAKTLVIGAHYDSVDTPGANDNASGVAVMLEAARLLSQQELKCNVQFVAFGSEEIGMVGSTYYLMKLDSKTRKNTIGLINLDMVGQGNKITIGAMDENAEYPILKLADQLLMEKGYTYGTASLSGSDNVPFEENGIQAAYFENNPYDGYHTDLDTIKVIQPDMLLKTLETVTNMSIEIAQNPNEYLMK